MHMFVYLFLSILTLASTNQQIVFTANDNSIVFHANWISDIRALDEKIVLFHQHLSKDSLEQIDLSFAYCTHHQYILDNIFKHQLKAKSVTINLDSCKIGNEGLTKILNNLDQSSIQSLALGLNSIGITESVISVLGMKLQRLKLKQLTLDLMFNKLGDKGLNELLMHPLNKELSQLHLDLTLNKLTPQSLRNFTHFLHLVEQSSMKKIVIKLGSNKIEEKGAQYLHSALRRFNQLQTLDIDLYFNSIKTKGATHICNIIKEQTKLKHLDINFDLNYIQTQGGKALGQALQASTQLESLSIGVANKNFGLNGFLQITTQLGQLSKLRSLTIKAGINRIGFKGIEKLSQALQKLTLQELDLGFTENFITDEGFQVISKAIVKQERLKSLKLNLGFNEARNYGPITLLKALQVKKYNDLSLGFSNNPLEDKDIKLMVPLIESMIRKNDRFELQFLQTKISEKLSKQIKQMFDAAISKGQRVQVHINSNQQTMRIREELQSQNKKKQQSQL